MAFVDAFVRLAVGAVIGDPVMVDEVPPVKALACCWEDGCFLVKTGVPQAQLSVVWLPSAAVATK